MSDGPGLEKDTVGFIGENKYALHLVGIIDEEDPDLIDTGLDAGDVVQYVLALEDDDGNVIFSPYPSDFITFPGINKASLPKDVQETITSPFAASYKGTYGEGESADYKKGSVVRYNGELWLAKVDVFHTPPVEGPNWTQLTGGGDFQDTDYVAQFENGLNT